MQQPPRHAHQLEGHTLCAQRWGSTRGPSVVLVHGLGVASTYYGRLASALAPSADVHVLELPGFGRAPKPAAPLGVEDLAAVVNAYARSAGLDRPMLVGHSMGSQVVLEAALQEPDRVHSVVGMGCVVDPRARTATRQGLRLLHDLLLESPSANWAVLRDYLRTGPRWYLGTLPHMLAYRTEEAATRLQVPLLIVRGARDPIATQGWSERLRQVTPAARLVVVPGAAHVVMHTHAAEVAALILREHAGMRETGGAPTPR